MPQLRRAVATLRVVGDELLPEEISSLLGAEPTQAQRKGQQFPSKSPSGARIARTGLWRLSATDTETGNVDTQVFELLDQLTPDLGIWNDLSQQYKVDLFCGWFMGSSNDGVGISSRTLLALGKRGIELAMDLYGPDEDA